MLFEMIWTFFKIGLFTIGGGYAMIPLITQEMVSKSWMTTAEVTDIIAIAKMTPGPFAVNTATFAGMKIFGIAGAVSATFGVILPSLIVTTLVARFFFNMKDHPLVQGALFGVRPVVVALIASAIITVISLTLFTDTENILTMIKSIDIKSIIVLFISLIMLLKIKLHPIIVISSSGLLGILLFL